MNDLPIVAETASMQISGVGSFSGELQLGRVDLDPLVQQLMVNAVEPWRAVLWVLQNDYPIWAGPIVAWQPTTALDGTLPIQAASMETILQYRIFHDQAITQTAGVIDSSNNRSKEIASPVIAAMMPVQPVANVSSASIYAHVTYAVNAGTDLFDLVRDACQYAVGKTITDANGNVLPVPTGATRIASLQTGNNESGVEIAANTVIIDPSQYQTVFDFLSTLVTNYGLEWCIQPGLTSTGNLQLLFQVGLPLGRQQTQTQLQIDYPSRNAIDYLFTRQAQLPTNALYAYGTDSANVVQEEAQYPYGFDPDELGNGYPLLEASVQVPTPTSSTPATAKEQCDAYAEGYVISQSILGQVNPTVILGADAWPQLSQVQMGDQVIFTATSPLHPANPNTGAPGLQMLGRITGWTLYFPANGQSETTQIVLAALTEVYL